MQFWLRSSLSPSLSPCTFDLLHTWEFLSSALIAIADGHLDHLDRVVRVGLAPVGGF